MQEDLLGSLFLEHSHAYFYYFLPHYVSSTLIEVTLPVYWCYITSPMHPMHPWDYLNSEYDVAYYYLPTHMAK